MNFMNKARLGGPDNSLSGRAQRAGGQRAMRALFDDLLCLRFAMAPGQRVVRATPFAI